MDSVDWELGLAREGLGGDAHSLMLLMLLCFSLIFFSEETIFGALMDTTEGVAGDIERRSGD